MNRSDGESVRKTKLSASETPHSDLLRKHASRSTKRVRKHRNTPKSKISVITVLLFFQNLYVWFGSLIFLHIDPELF